MLHGPPRVAIRPADAWLAAMMLITIRKLGNPIRLLPLGVEHVVFE